MEWIYLEQQIPNIYKFQHLWRQNVLKYVNVLLFTGVAVGIYLRPIIGYKWDKIIPATYVINGIDKWLIRTQSVIDL